MSADDLDLLIRSLDGALDAEETRRLKRLLRVSPAARAELERLQSLRGLVAAQSPRSFSPHFTDGVMQRVLRLEPPAPAPDRFARLQTWLLSWRGVGWSLALVVLLVSLGLWLRPRAVQAPYGTTASVTLPDGSDVELAPGSTLRYARRWGQETRRVRLEGEAFFDVAPEARVFVVETFNARVRVTGTRFNVRAWKDDLERQTQVVLASGRVEVRPRRAAAEPVRLAPGEALAVASDTTAPRPPTPARLDRALAWRSGGLAFVNQPLGSVFNALERRFDTEITLASADLAHRSLTYLNPRPASITDVLSDICHAHGLQYRRTAGGFYVTTP